MHGSFWFLSSGSSCMIWCSHIHCKETVYIAKTTLGVSFLIHFHEDLIFLMYTEAHLCTPQYTHTHTYTHRETGPRCPVDNTRVSHQQLFKDNFAKREVLSLNVRCSAEEFGCKWSGELRNLDVCFKVTCNYMYICAFLNLLKLEDKRK